MDQISDDKNTDQQWLEGIAIKEAMKKLNDREKHIVNLRFFAGKTQMEVAEEIGISQAQVSRLEKAALKQLKNICDSKRFRPIFIRMHIYYFLQWNQNKI